MDPNRFDRLSKSIASRLTRRQIIGGLGAGGVATAVFGDSSPRAAADGPVTCVYDFDATIDFGPSSKLPSSAEFAGELTITIEADGSINDAKLVKNDGQTWKVVGQATGRAINLRFSVPHTGAVVAVGTGRGAIASCTAAMGGPASGPVRHDAGSWTASLKSGGQSTPTTAAPTAQAAAPTAASVVQPTDTPADQTAPGTAAACELECGADTLGLDSANCVCLCASGLTSCTFEVGSIPAKGGVIFNAKPLTTPTGFCLDLSNDTSNCGSCRNFCPYSSHMTDYACVNGACQGDCAAGFGSCDPTNPCETNFSTDKNNCGACGNACSGDGQGCVNGQCACVANCGPGGSVDANCQCTCAAGLTSCGASCVDTNTDVNNCGGCGQTCGPIVSECSAGKCHAVVQSGA